jgi:hypothetical protein
MAGQIKRVRSRQLLASALLLGTGLFLSFSSVSAYDPPYTVHLQPPWQSDAGAWARIAKFGEPGATTGGNGSSSAGLGQDLGSFGAVAGAGTFGTGGSAALLLAPTEIGDHQASSFGEGQAEAYRRFRVLGPPSVNLRDSIRVRWTAFAQFAHPDASPAPSYFVSCAEVNFGSSGPANPQGLWSRRLATFSTTLNGQNYAAMATGTLTGYDLFGNESIHAGQTFVLEAMVAAWAGYNHLQDPNHAAEESGTFTMNLTWELETTDVGVTVEEEEVPMADWTILAYLNGDNNLEAAALDDFLEMAAVGSSEDVNILVQLDRHDRYSTEYGDWTTTRRFRVQQGDTPASTPLADLGELNMADPAVLQDFILWGIHNYPARHLMLIVWDHGGGWGPREAGTRGVAWDEKPFAQDYLTTAELAQAVDVLRWTGRKLDIIGMDACLMGSAEVAYQIRGSCQYFIGSEEVEPGDGWAYDGWLANVNSNALPLNICTDVVNTYAAQGSGYHTQTAVATSTLDNLATQVDALAGALRANLATERAHIEQARQDPALLEFATPSYVDLGQLCLLLQTYCQADAIVNAAIDARAALASARIAHHTQGTKYAVAEGLSIYFPEQKPDMLSGAAGDSHDLFANYVDESTEPANLAFVGDTRWDDFLKAYLEAAPAELQIGLLTIRADVAVAPGPGQTTWYFNTNVSINNLLYLTGEVTADLATLRVNGDGEIWLRGTPVLGDVLVYQGAWEIDASSAVTTALQAVQSDLKALGLDVEVTHFEIIPDGVRVQGNLVMPAVLGGAKLAITGSDYLQVTTTAGLEWSSAVITIANAQGLEFLGLPFNVSSVQLRVSSTEIQVRGIVELPATLGGITLDLSTDTRHVRITDADGNGIPEIELVGTLAIAGPIPLSGQLTIETIELDFDTGSGKLTGTATLNTPWGMTLPAAVEFVDGFFDSVQVNQTNMNVVVVTGPTPEHKPIVWWQDVSASVNDVASSPPPATLGGTMAFEAGPMLASGVRLLRLEVEGTLDSTGRLTGTGRVLLGGNPLRSPAFEFDPSDISIDPSVGVYVHGHMRFGSTLDVDGAVRLGLDNHLQGRLVGTVRAPSWLGGLTLGDIVLYAQFYDDADLTNDYFVGALKGLFGFEHAIRIDIHTGAIDWDASTDLIDDLEVPDGGSGNLPVAFDVPAGLAGVVFRADWETGDTDLHLTRPDSTVITPENVHGFADVAYFKNAETLEAMYTVVAPAAGQWLVDLTNTNGIGTYRIEQRDTTVRPQIALLTPSTDATVSPVSITWNDADPDSDATIALHYDTDRSGADGVEIVRGLSEDATTNSFTWDTAGLPTGNYYVYATIDDGFNMPVVAYSLGRAIVIDPAAPGAPTGLGAVPGDNPGELKLAWTAGTGAVHHHVVGLTAYPAGESYEVLVTTTSSTTTTLTGLTVGQTYRLAVAALDADGRRGAFSAPIVVPVLGAVNNAPVFTGGIATRATVGVLYSSQILSADRDGQTVQHGLAEQPAGMTVTTGGLIEWTPTAEQVGDHPFEVTLSDGVGGTNRRSVVINVADNSTGNRPPEIVSEVVPVATPGALFTYQVLAVDPDSGDALSYTLPIGPSGATITAAGQVRYTVPYATNRHEFVVRVADVAGAEAVQRFTIQSDITPPAINASAWGTVTAVAPDTLEVSANPIADAVGPVEYQLQVNSVDYGPWTRTPRWVVTGQAPNTSVPVRVKARDGSPTHNVSGWGTALSRYTFAAVPPMPTLVQRAANSVQLSLSPGTNPSSTVLALWNATKREWINASGLGSATPVWQASSTWAMITVKNLTFDTTYDFQVKARNQQQVETELSEALTVQTLATASDVSFSVPQDWLYENAGGSTTSRLTLSATFINDAYANASYVYTWVAPVHPITGKSLVLVAGGGPNDTTATYAAPERPARDPYGYAIQCTITGVQHGNAVTDVVQVRVLGLPGDYDGDGDSDLADYAVFPDCLSGPGATPAPVLSGATLLHCLEAFDSDHDADVDLVDFGALSTTATP